MLFSEFKTRMGREVTEFDYNLANAIYMESDIDKDEFCAEWKKLEKVATFKTLLCMWCVAHKEKSEALETIESLKEELSNTETLIETIEQNHKDEIANIEATATETASLLTHEDAIWFVQFAAHNDMSADAANGIRDKVIAMVGEREYYALVVKYGCPDANDMDRIAELLTA